MCGWVGRRQIPNRLRPHRRLWRRKEIPGKRCSGIRVRARRELVRKVRFFGVLTSDDDCDGVAGDVCGDGYGGDRHREICALI